jgi:hypothetical protein
MMLKVVELHADLWIRDEALRLTRRLEAAIAAEREKVVVLLNADYEYGSDY